jgi:hypothetical protein
MKSHYIFLLLLLVFGCKENSNTVLTIEYEKLFDSIPSASGLAIKDSIAYIVCDDGTGIYKINLRNFGQNKIRLGGFPLQQYREPKSSKHDFESACFATWQGNEYLIAIGSGSGGSVRDSLLMMNTTNYADQKIYSLGKFYKQLQLITSTENNQLNIEGVTIASDSIVILNRGNNLLITCGTNAFFSSLINQQDSFPQLRYRKIQLPFIEQREARFSGICTIDEKHLLFCASVEDTPDWTKDGPVLGSYFGIYSLEENKVIATYLLKDKQNQIVKEKIESVDIIQKTTDDLIFQATGDNDNGTSKLFQLKLRGPKWE